MMDMEYTLESDGQHRLEQFLERIGMVLGDEKRRASFATYAIGLLSDGERKSMEPIAARSCPDPSRVDAGHQRLAHFVSNSNWSDEDVRREATGYALQALTARESVIGCVPRRHRLSQARHPLGGRAEAVHGFGRGCEKFI